MFDTQAKSTVVCRLSPTLVHAIESAGAKLGREPNAIVEEIVTEWAVREGLVPEKNLRRLRLYHGLIDDARKTAVEICSQGRFTDAVTRDVFLTLQQDANFIERYREFIGGDPYSPRPIKARLNQGIGTGIREAIGGVAETDSAGRPMKRKVSGMIIGAYTVMRSFDETTYATRGAA